MEFESAASRIFWAYSDRLLALALACMIPFGLGKSQPIQHTTVSYARRVMAGWRACWRALMRGRSVHPFVSLARLRRGYMVMSFTLHLPIAPELPTYTERH